MTPHLLSAEVEEPPAAPIRWEPELARHERWLRTVILARGVEPYAVDEVMQEVALAALEGKSPLRKASSTGAWLYRLAVVKAVRYRRERARHRRKVERYASRVRERQDVQAVNPLAWLLHEERCDLVRRGLAQLSARDAEVLLLKYTEQWTCRELAEHLGISESAADGRLIRARERLRQVLAGLMIDG
jgi:RNA polymerase sigma-70 factor (ECF subfamily)